MTPKTASNPRIPTPPKHLKPRSKAFWKRLCDEYTFETADLERLRLVCESLDTVDAAEADVRTRGLLVPGTGGTTKANPSINIARDARQLVLRGLRELAIDIELPGEARVPRQERRYH